jgi:hypothetical protein
VNKLLLAGIAKAVLSLAMISATAAESLPISQTPVGPGIITGPPQWQPSHILNGRDVWSGLTDRQAWEDWFASIKGDARHGAA